MKDNKALFDFCVGNPPYQETKGGTKNVDIWPDFIDSATQIANESCLIHPGRWVNPKKNMMNTHKHLVQSGLIRFKYFPNAANVFNGVNIDGGITITMFKNGYEGDINYAVNNVSKGKFDNCLKFFSDKYEEEVYEKIFVKMNSSSIEHRILGNTGSLAGGEFGYYKHSMIDKLKSSPEGMDNPIHIWANAFFGKGTRFQWHYIDKKYLKDIPNRLLSSRKVMLDKKGNAISHGRGNVINNLPQIVEAKATASGDVLFVFPEKDTDYDLQLIKSMFMTKTVRFLMSITQKDLYVRGFENVPDYISFVPMLNGQLFSDQFFYKQFNFSEELIHHIEECVSPKEDNKNI